MSSLLLWLDEKRRWDEGRRVHRLQTPLVFLLELTAILLLVLAAARPLIRFGEGARPLVIVLDDSFSMLAGGENSARGRATKAILTELEANRYAPLRFILAGERPQLLGEANGGLEQARGVLRNWRCGAPTAQLEATIAFAFELGGSRTRVLVITDRGPEQEIGDSRMQWWSFGEPLPNLAFVNATRSARDGEEDSVLLELANLSTHSTTTSLSMETSGPPVGQSLTLGPGESRRVTLAIKNKAAPLHASIERDELGADNEVVLMPETGRTVRVELHLKDSRLRELVERAVRAAPQARVIADQADLVVSDGDFSLPESDAWELRIFNEQGASSYLGPFIVDRAHPLTEGLSLGGTVWGAGKSPLPGTPILMAGNVPLVTDVEREGKHEIRLRLQPELSTLQQTPNWPILIWNLIAWRASVAPGLRQANLRLGGEAKLLVQSGVGTIGVIDPARQTRQLPVRDNSVAIKADAVGVYELTADQTKYAFAVNALSREESDLTQARSGRWGNWANAPSFQWEYRSIVWLLLLLALGILVIHGWMASRLTSS